MPKVCLARTEGRRQRGRDRGQQRNPQQRQRRGVDAPRLGPQPLDLGEHRDSPPVQRDAGLGELDRAQIAVDQPDAERGLQVLEMLGGGRLGHAQHLRRLRHVARLDHGHEHLDRTEQIEVELRTFIRRLHPSAQKFY